MVEINIDMDGKCKDCGKPGITGSGYCLSCATKELKRRQTMPDITKLKNIQGVGVTSKVVFPKEGNAKIVSTVHFSYEGEPSEVQNVMILESQHQAIDATFFSPQYSLPVSGPDARD